MNAVEMVNVFCHRGGGGNPTGLALDASGMTDDQMRGVAEACGHESGFILPPSGASPDADFRFRYFVPRHEMEMCGHATVGALWLLRDKGRIGPGTYRIETLSGPVTGYVGETIAITQPRGTVAAADEFRDDILDVLRLDPAALADRPIQNARTSRVKTLVPVRDADTLNAIQPDFPRVEALCDALGSTGLYPYAVISESDGTFEARQFPRASGYPEDAATGIAATALAFGLLENGLVARPEQPLRIFQGRAMGRLSEIQVRFAKAPDGTIDHCLLAGEVMPVA